MASPIEPFLVGPLHDVLTIKPPPSPPPTRLPPPIRPAIFRTQLDLDAHYSDNPEAHHLVFTDLRALKNASATPVNCSRWEKALRRTPPVLRMVHATRMPRSVPPDHFDLYRRLAAVISKTSGAPDLNADGSLAYSVPYVPRKLGRSNIDFLPATMPVHHALMAPPLPSWLRYQKMLILRTPWTPVAEEKRALLDEVNHGWKTDVTLYVRISDSQYEGTVFMPQPKEGQVFPPELMASLLELRRTADQKGHEGYMAAYQAAERHRAHAIRVWCAASPGVVLSVEPDRFIRRWPPLLQDVLREYQTAALKQGSSVYAEALAECSAKMVRLVKFYADCGLLHGARPQLIDWRLSSWWKIPRYGINDASGNSVAWPKQLEEKLNAALARFGVGSHVTWFSRALLLALWKESLIATNMVPDVQVLECQRFPLFIVKSLAQVWRERFTTGLDMVEDQFIALLAKFREWAAEPENQMAMQLGSGSGSGRCGGAYDIGATEGGIAASRQEIAEWLAADDAMKNLQSTYDGLYEVMGWKRMTRREEMSSESPSGPSDVSDDEAVDSPVSSAAGSPVVAAAAAAGAGSSGSVAVTATHKTGDDSVNDGDDEASDQMSNGDHESDDDEDMVDDYYFDTNAEPTLDELRFKAALELSISTAARRLTWPVQQRRRLRNAKVGVFMGGSGIGRVVKGRGSKRS